MAQPPTGRRAKPLLLITARWLSATLGQPLSMGVSMPTKLETLLRQFTRAVGHTTASVDIALRCNGILFVANEHQAHELRRKDPKLFCVSLNELDDQFVVGRRMPILVDHYALQVMVHEQVDELEKVRTQLSAARATLVNISHAGYRMAKRGKKLTRADKERNHLVQLAKHALAQP
jgi:hypothetical protein